MAKINEYLKDSKGNPSSTRWFSSLFMWFFFLSNIMVLAMIFLGKTTIDTNTLIFVLTYDFLLLLATFAPKQLAKIEEIKELISLSKGK